MVYGNTVSICLVFELYGAWYNPFKDGRTLADSEPRDGGPSTSQKVNVTDEVQTLVMQENYIRVCELIKDMEISVHLYIDTFDFDRGFEMKRVPVNFVLMLIMMLK
ncbi:hypothetical protein NPIL_652091 [Nephila pilipes]|uniref:Uncharacterized protein n=1 Tax=Nephila pilipes TaxID=299642 RepID=A0A8X6QXD6_NEPPI|nr:hypothetical protein NPIL_652091 [Nephila pilipes]